MGKQRFRERSRGQNQVLTLIHWFQMSSESGLADPVRCTPPLCTCRLLSWRHSLLRMVWNLFTIFKVVPGNEMQAEWSLSLHLPPKLLTVRLEETRSQQSPTNVADAIAKDCIGSCPQETAAVCFRSWRESMGKQSIYPLPSTSTFPPPAP